MYLLLLGCLKDRGQSGSVTCPIQNMTCNQKSINPLSCSLIIEHDANAVIAKSIISGLYVLMKFDPWRMKLQDSNVKKSFKNYSLSLKKGSSTLYGDFFQTMT